MVSEAMRARLLAAAGAGRLHGDDVSSGAAEHPACGDVVQFDVRIGGGRIVALAWQATGCPATLAVAAVAHEACTGAPCAEAAARLRARVGALGGLERHERHAERIALDALGRAIGAT